MRPLKSPTWLADQCTHAAIRHRYHVESARERLRNREGMTPREVRELVRAAEELLALAYPRADI